MTKVAILHEGHAGNKSRDNWLLKTLIEHQGLDVNQVQFFGMGSKSNFFKPDYKDYKALLPEIENDQITKALFVVDSDSSTTHRNSGGYENSLKLLQDITQHLGIATVSNFFICCDPITQEGNIEDLLLSTLDTEKTTCINNFIECSDFEAIGNSKAILNRIYEMAYPRAPFNLEHEHFDELKKRLRELLS